MILLVHSNLDIAGKNIANQIHQLMPFTETNQTYQQTPTYNAEVNGKPVTHITLTEEAVNAQTIPENFPNTQLVIFLSRHSSQTGTPTLSVHTPGNFSTAELGGKPKNLSVSPANAMQTALKTLNKLQQEKHLNYEVSYECTHHGPTLNTPTMFVELGSSPQQWEDQQAAKTVAQAAIEAIADFGKSKQPAVVGIGGPHYNRKFTKLALEKNIAFSHIIPKHAVPFIDAQMLQQCVDKTMEKVEYIILDWKGIRSQDKPTLLANLKQLNLPTKKV